ncbi:MAG TPA: ATP-binding protein [Acidimicrobiia bacterium]|nr:ATP-binding protein [Acidimicrobiia bacterium]
MGHRRARSGSHLIATTAFVAVIALAALAVLAYSAVTVSSNAVQGEAKREVAASAQASAVAVNDELGGLSELVQSYARRPQLVAEVGDGRSGSIARAGLHADLDELRRTRSNIALAFVSNDAGVLLDILPETPSILGKDFSYRDWYRGVTATNAPYVSSVYRTAATGHPLVVAAAAPIFAPGTSSRVGILVVAYRLDTLQDYVDHFSGAQGVSITVTDQTGVEVATPGSSVRTTSSLRRDPQIAAALRGRSVVSVRHASTGATIAASVPIHPLGWTLLAEVPRRSVLGRVNGLRKTVTLVAILLALIVGAGVLLMLRAVRRQARADRELRESRDELRAGEERLALARDAAEHANQAKSEFLSRMSHELRTPLNAILGFSQLLEHDALDDDQRESVALIRRAGRHLLELINEVLDISRIEAGRLSVSIEPVNLADVVTEAIELVRPIAADRGIEVPARAPEGCDRFVRADRHRLRQILVNLLANAVKYNRDHGRVDIGCEEADGRVRVSITDTGGGISAENQTRLFRPFERLGADETDIEGTGLGLAVTSRLIDALGGTIGVDSEVGTGSTFWIELPNDEAPIAALNREPGRAEIPITDGAARTVLYVEDNPANIMLVRRLLDRRPHITLRTAKLGAEGIAAATDSPPDLVLLDLNLPDLSGELVLQRLRADPRTRAIPVIVVSADATPTQIERLRALGAADYVTKPFDIGALLAAIDRAASTYDGALVP